MFEQIRIKTIEHRPYIALFLGIFYVLVAFFTTRFFFKDIISIAMLFLVTLLLVPTVFNLMSVEEKRERKDGIRHFLKDHKDIFEIYFFLFVGIFIGFLIVGNTDSFSYQMDFLKSQQGLSSQLIQEKTAEGLHPSAQSIFGILSNNVKVVIISFILSFFYGAGSMFLIVFNASIFAAFVIFVMKSLQRPELMAVLMVHTIPELMGFLLAAVAGGVLSKAVIQEKFLSEKFKNVVKDAQILFIISLFVILIAALLEVYVTTGLINWIL